MKHILRKVIAIATVVTMLAAVPAMDAQAAVVKYATYTNTRFTYTVKYPSTFRRADYSSGDGTKLFSKDGKAKATIWNSYGKTGKKRKDCRSDGKEKSKNQCRKGDKDRMQL